MKIAVEGCAHGELDKIYETIELLEKKNNIKIDMLLICGDFQSVRNPADLECMAVPPKYRTMNSFYKYYSGEKVAPVLTIFIGGNHEASNYLSELPYGGWVCPNIFYMGYANVINVAGVRIAGLSGIYKARDYLRGHFESPPYNESSKKSIYHVRNLDVFRLKQLQNPVDICLSHDWPTGVYNYGNKEELLRWKPFFREEMKTNKLGSQPAEELLRKLKPSYWFSAHLHCKFSAIVPHDDQLRPETKFLALDKCLPRRSFLQVVDIESKSDTVQIEYDAEWLSILRSTDHLLSVSNKASYMPGQGSEERWDFRPTDEEIQYVRKLFNNDFTVPENFSVTAPTYIPEHQCSSDFVLKTYNNPQTEIFCKNLSITDPLSIVLNKSRDSFSISDFCATDTDMSYQSTNPEEISMDEEEDDDIPSEVSKADMDIEPSDDFIIDKVGSRPDSPNSDDFVIDKTRSQFEILETDDFFIDKVGSLNNDVSSDFIRNSTSSQNLCSTPISKTEYHSKPVEIIAFPEIREENICIDNNVGDEEPTPSLKKFKRRNYDLYKSEDNIM
ncbi:lariat debranching enzyme-like [Argiope bruennichi]|uniref:lariat debranching enzyme-like n=1 Tax=Argiope bruennichi TaxID=94029 RepID=UPI00249491A5|nr:lariat debranching enzyme-like [Argiope bruennichi]